MEQMEYMNIPITLIPKEFMKLFKLLKKVVRNHIYLEIQKGIYGLSEAGRFANNLIQKQLESRSYHDRTIPGLWRHNASIVVFTLIVDNF